jgi:hypothetical protein
MRKNMNADKLLKIAKLLDEKNHFALADKVDKIAQNAGRYYNPNAGETWYNRLGRIFSGNATIEDYPGLAANARFVDTVKQRMREKNRRQNNYQNNYQNRDPYGIRNQSQQFGFQQNQQPQQQNQPVQQQNPLLASTTPQQFVQNLFQFGKQNNIGTLAQTMETYAQQGGTLNGQPINQNPQTLNLYNQIKNYSGILTPQQILSMLTGSGQ